MLLLPNRWWVLLNSFKGMRISYRNPDLGFTNKYDADRLMHKLNRHNEHDSKYTVAYGVVIQGQYFNRDSPGE